MRLPLVFMSLGVNNVVRLFTLVLTAELASAACLPLGNSEIRLPEGEVQWRGNDESAGVLITGRAARTTKQ